MSDKTFRNRRGHKVSINEAVSDIENKEPKQPSKDAVAKPAIPLQEKKSIKSNKVKKTKQVLPQILRSKKFIAVVLGIIALLIFGVFIIADGVKRDYERQGAAMRRDVTTLSSSPSSRETPAPDIARDLRAALDEPTSCRGSAPLSAWYTPARQAKDTCQTIARDYESLKQNLQVMEQNARYVDTIGGSLRTALQNPSSGTFASITEYSDRWSDAADRISSTEPPAELEDAHTALREKVEKIRDSWLDLRSANADENRDVFESAEEQLTDEYKAIRTSYQEISKVTDSTQKNITELVARLVIE